jgi:hypothetical protein
VALKIERGDLAEDAGEALPSMSASSRTYDALSRFLPISAAGVVVICSTPTTSTMRARLAAIALSP